VVSWFLDRAGTDIGEPVPPGGLVPLLGVEELQNILATSFPGADVPSVESVSDADVLVRLSVGERHGRPGGTVSGPAMMALADTAAWVCVMAATGPLVLAVTTSLHINFLRKPALSDLMARGRLLKLGKQLAVCDVELFSAGTTDLVAKAQVTYSLPPRTPA
jgi:uncharacterized protein (TIGR00369 family)